MEKNNIKVCVTGGSGYLGSWMIKKLLQRGYIVHATLRNLGDDSKTKILRSLPNAETNLKLFQADIYTPQEYEKAIKDCEYVLHLATPLSHNQDSEFKDVSEAAVAGIRSIADSCVRSRTIKRLVYTSTVFAASPLMEDGSGFKPQMDESCWSSVNLPYKYIEDFFMDYIKSKTLSDKEILKYNNEELEVVSLVCGLVGGDTLLPNITSSILPMMSQLTGDRYCLDVMKLLQEMLGSIPLLHIDDACEAHIFCIERENSFKGHFMCAVESPTLEEIATCYQEINPQIQIPQELKCGPDGGRRCRCDLSKLRDEVFRYKYGMREIILEGNIKCSKRLGFLF